MGAAHVALRVATEHASHLGDALVAVEDAAVGRRHAAARALGDEDVMMPARRDLRQVADGENLMVRIPPGQYSLGLKYEGQGPLNPQPPAHEREKAFVESVVDFAGGKYHDLRIVPDERWNWQLSRAGD